MAKKQTDSLGQFVGEEKIEKPGGTLFKGTKDGKPWQRYTKRPEGYKPTVEGKETDGMTPEELAEFTQRDIASGGGNRVINPKKGTLADDYTFTDKTNVMDDLGLTDGEENVMTSDLASQYLANTDKYISDITEQTEQMREEAKTMLDEEVESLRRDYEKQRELSEQEFEEQQGTREAIQYRLGQSGTEYALDRNMKAAQAKQRYFDTLEAEKNSKIAQLKSAYRQENYEAVAQLRNDVYEANQNQISFLQNERQRQVNNYMDSIREMRLGEQQEYSQMVDERNFKAKQDEIARKAKEKQIDYERVLAEEGYRRIGNRTEFEELISQYGATAETFSTYFYKDPADGTIYLKPQEEIEGDKAKNYFTNTQLAKGAEKAGVPISEFGDFPVDKANAYIYGSGMSGSGGGGGGSRGEDKEEETEEGDYGQPDQAFIDDFAETFQYTPTPNDELLQEAWEKYNRLEDFQEEFTKTQKLKLEQAGLADATREEQLNFLYGKEE